MPQAEADKRVERQRGISLAEVLVAMTVLALAISIALVLYEGTRRSFRVGDNLTEQQQVVRIAFDLMTRELRMAGYNYNPDGDRTRPDEQIEAAYEMAVVFRADLDGEDPTASREPEDDLADTDNGSAFFSVSTGNDEIVAYVLGKPDSQSIGTLSFEADLTPGVRDGVVESIDIDEVDLTQDQPPYTLYRINFRHGQSTAQRVPLIDNVRSLRFVYYDAMGSEITPSGGEDDDEGIKRRERASIRRIGVEIEAITRDPDQRWIDPDDSNPLTRGHRKFKLDGDVTPRNLGMAGLAGLRDLNADSTPPSKPAPPRVYGGHCKGLFVTWSPNPSQEEVARYELHYGPDASAFSGLEYALEPGVYLDGLDDAAYYNVVVKAVDDSGQVSDPSPMVGATTQNLNTPDSPPNVDPSLIEENRVDVAWDAVTENAGPPPFVPSKEEDPLSPDLRDLAGYRVYRDEVEPFAADAEHLIADETLVTAAQNPGFSDERVVSCREYHYRVAAVDECGQVGEASLPARRGESSTSRDPAAPGNFQAFKVGLNGVHVMWDPVRENELGDPIHVEDYYLYTTGPRSKFLPPPTSADFSGTPIPVDGQNYWDGITMMGPGMTVYYAVAARDDCINESVLSEPAEPSCSFSGTVVFGAPAYGQQVSGDVPIQVRVDQGTGLYLGLELSMENQATGEIVTTLNDGSSGPWLASWEATPAQNVDPGVYLIRASVEQAGPPSVCSQVTTIKVLVEAP